MAHSNLSSGQKHYLFSLCHFDSHVFTMYICENLNQRLIRAVAIKNIYVQERIQGGVLGDCPSLSGSGGERKKISPAEHLGEGQIIFFYFQIFPKMPYLW